VSFEIEYFLDLKIEIELVNLAMITIQINLKKLKPHL